MIQVYDAQVDDRIARLPAAYKQLLHLIAQDIAEEQWASRLRATRKQVEDALVVLSETVGAKSDDRTERILGIQRIGQIFFKISKHEEGKQAYDEDFQFPTIEQLISTIRTELSPLQYRKVRAIARSEYGRYETEARKLRISEATLRGEIPYLFKQIGFLPLQKKNFVRRRHELLQEAFKQIEAPQPEPA